ncbi:hypothetical protein [Sulfitobacter phage vB_SupP_AX]|nr:hypothetical protein [Sulfitobacter phage vB_SupP_AX]
MVSQKTLKDLIDDYVDNDVILKAMEEKLIYGIIVDQSEDTIRFQFSDADVLFYHNQDCCESVVIDDINGNFEDMVGDMLLLAEERVSDDETASESGTWTFYTFRSLRESVDVKWHGTSNGYYSERVDIDVVQSTLNMN